MFGVIWKELPLLDLYTKEHWTFYFSTVNYPHKWIIINKNLKCWHVCMNKTKESTGRHFLLLRQSAVERHRGFPRKDSNGGCCDRSSTHCPVYWHTVTLKCQYQPIYSLTFNVFTSHTCLLGLTSGHAVPGPSVSDAIFEAGVVVVLTAGGSAGVGHDWVVHGVGSRQRLEHHIIWTGAILMGRALEAQREGTSKCTTFRLQMWQSIKTPGCAARETSE